MRRALLAAALLVAACTTTQAETTTSMANQDGQSSTTRTESTTATTAARTATPSSLVCWSASPNEGSGDIAFVDVTASAGLVDPLTGMHGHAAGWGDVNGDAIPDLVVGTFANRPIANYQLRGADGPRADTLLIGGGDGTFSVAEGFPEVFGRTSGAALADLDNDGDNDIVLSRNMRDRERGDAPTQVYRNDGDSFSLVDLDLGRFVGGRSIGVLDHNHDGLLDLFIVEDRYAGGRSSVLLENRGDLQFVDVTTAAGLPTGVSGLGVMAADLSGDGQTDLFVAGANRLFVATDTGFVEADSSVFVWEVFGNEDDVASAAVGDIDRDGLPDLVVGHHYNSTLSKDIDVPIRAYRNIGNDGSGLPRFEDTTTDWGLIGLPTKAPHVEVVDVDNDGWLDIVTTASSAQGTRPAVFRNLGPDSSGTLAFDPPSGLGSAQYWVSGPMVDIDRDGRVDLLLVEWEPSLPSLLLRNETPSGHWIEVSIGQGHAAGTKVVVWEAGGMHDPDSLLASTEIVLTSGYTAGVMPWAHIGLGEIDTVDIRVETVDGEIYEAERISADAHLRFPNGCG